MDVLYGILIFNCIHASISTDTCPVPICQLNNKTVLVQLSVYLSILSVLFSFHYFWFISIAVHLMYMILVMSTLSRTSDKDVILSLDISVAFFKHLMCDY